MKAYHVGFLASFILSPGLVFAAQSSSVRAVSESKYTKAHSLVNNYSFDPRDGWQSINVTNLQYKYRRQEEPEPDLAGDLRGNSQSLENRSKKKKVHTAPHKTGSLGQVIAGVVADIWRGLKGLGKPEPVTITWYTGHDLEKPSCWANSEWAPTDESFACALTSEGWTNRPKCFKFLELCHTPKKCVFVRVVDTCAGCAPGSKHVDLTRAAFKQLADLDVGTLTVQFRPATEPDRWSEKLWGPKVIGH